MRIIYRGKGKLVIAFPMKFLVQLECYPPWWWKGRFEHRPGYLRIAWGLFQLKYLTASAVPREIELEKQRIQAKEAHL
jgi:hypothetical protein